MTLVDTNKAVEYFHAKMEFTTGPFELKSLIDSDENINIIDVNQRIMESYFVMTMAADFSKATKSMESMKVQLDKLAQKMKLNITLQNERIFEAIHRI